MVFQDLSKSTIRGKPVTGLFIAATPCTLVTVPSGFVFCFMTNSVLGIVAMKIFIDARALSLTETANCS
nr:MAG: hypothetical protein [Bacteriophage sp.]